MNESNKPMVRFKLVNGESYTILGDEAIKAYRELSATPETCVIKHDDKSVMISLKYIVSIEWKGVE